METEQGLFQHHAKKNFSLLIVLLFRGWVLTSAHARERHIDKACVHVVYVLARSQANPCPRFVVLSFSQKDSKQPATSQLMVNVFSPLINHIVIEKVWCHVRLLAECLRASAASSSSSCCCWWWWW